MTESAHASTVVENWVHPSKGMMDEVLPPDRMFVMLADEGDSFMELLNANHWPTDDPETVLIPSSYKKKIEEEGDPESSNDQDTAQNETEGSKSILTDSDGFKVFTNLSNLEKTVCMKDHLIRKARELKPCTECNYQSLFLGLASSIMQSGWMVSCPSCKSVAFYNAKSYLTADSVIQDHNYWRDFAKYKIQSSDSDSLTEYAEQLVEQEVGQDEDDEQTHEDETEDTTDAPTDGIALRDELNGIQGIHVCGTERGANGGEFHLTVDDYAILRRFISEVFGVDVDLSTFSGIIHLQEGWKLETGDSVYTLRGIFTKKMEEKMIRKIRSVFGEQKSSEQPQTEDKTDESPQKLDQMFKNALNKVKGITVSHASVDNNRVPHLHICPVTDASMEKFVNRVFNGNWCQQDPRRWERKYSLDFDKGLFSDWELQPYISSGHCAWKLEASPVHRKKLIVLNQALSKVFGLESSSEPISGQDDDSVEMNGEKVPGDELHRKLKSLPFIQVHDMIVTTDGGGWWVDIYFKPDNIIQFSNLIRDSFGADAQRHIDTDGRENEELVYGWRLGTSIYKGERMCHISGSIDHKTADDIAGRIANDFNV